MRTLLTYQLSNFSKNPINFIKFIENAMRLSSRKKRSLDPRDVDALEKTSKYSGGRKMPVVRSPIPVHACVE